jgi:hypothetical protein
MTVASLLSLLSASLSFVAFAFFMIGLARTTRLAARRRQKPVYGKDAERPRIAQRVDWQCAAALFGIALVAVVASRLATGPAFTEPSGNVVGGALLVAAIVLVVVLLTLFLRHAIVSRALRRQDAGQRRKPSR